MSPAPADLPPRSRSRSRLTALITVAVIGAFAIVLVVSAQRAAVPVGSGGGMSGMSMARGSGMRMTLRDVSGRSVRIPGGRPGAVVFVEVTGCRDCVRLVRAATRLSRRGGGQVVVLAIDSGSTRAQLQAFARAAGRPPARYVVDDRNGSVASMFDAQSIGSAVVYDERGRVVGRPSSVAELRRALGRATG